jgi:hypothetical protein
MTDKTAAPIKIRLILLPNKVLLSIKFLSLWVIPLADVETITKGVALSKKQPEGVINNEQLSVNYTFPRYISMKLSVATHHV